MNEKPNIVHLNGELLPASAARVSPFDRGFIFGDAIYEGLRATERRVIAPDRHAARMAQGLDACRISGFDPASLGALSRELLDANDLDEAFIYWQVSRGTPRPDQLWRGRVPEPDLMPTVFGVAVPERPVASYDQPPTRTAIVLPDARWHNGHIKSTSLLGNVLASMDAADAGAEDAILVRDGLVGEATASNLFLALGRRVVTPSLGSISILAGVTRDLILDADPTIEQRPVTLDELRNADEVILAGTRTMVTSVVALDGRQVGDGRPGPRARALLGALLDAIRADIHSPHA
jgi:D-alanine transaminase